MWVQLSQCGWVGGGTVVQLWKWPWYERPWSSKSAPCGYWETDRPETWWRLPPPNPRVGQEQRDTLTWTTLWVSTSEVCTVKWKEKIPAGAAVADWTDSPEFSFTSLMKSTSFLGGSATCTLDREVMVWHFTQLWRLVIKPPSYLTS